MATIKQKKALDNLVGNGGNVTQAMLAANYSPATANTPQKLTESVGFKKLLEERGLTETFLLDALVEDIEKKPQNRLGEMRLASEILNINKGEESKGNTMVVVLPGAVQIKNGLSRSTEHSGE